MSGTSARGAHAADPRRWFGPEDGPWFERDDWADGSRYRSADDARRAQATELRRTGVVTLPGAAPEALCREAIEALEPHFARTGAARLTNAAWALEPIRRLAQLPEVIELVTWLYGRTAIPFQTLDFRHGTEQAAHRDDEHFDSLPPGFMCGAWVALEPIGPEQGPVAYLPRSTPGPVGAADLVPFTADVGDVLVWSASLLHGGTPIDAPGATRWSHVTHYVFEGCVWYTPRHSDLAAGELELRLPLLDVATLRRGRPMLGAAPARFVHGRGRRARLIPASAPPVSWSKARRWRALRPTVGPVVQARWSRLTGRPPRP